MNKTNKELAKALKTVADIEMAQVTQSINLSKLQSQAIAENKARDKKARESAKKAMQKEVEAIHKIIENKSMKTSALKIIKK